MFSLFRPNYWFFVLLAYFAAQIGLRVTVQTRDFDAARGTPSFLYEWLHSLIATMPIPANIAVAVYSNIVLFLTFIAIFQAVRRFGRMDWAWVTTLSLFFIPQIVWVGQHSDGVVDLATLMAAASIWAFAWMLDQRNLVSYGLFGAITGLSALTSISALLVPMVLLLATATHSAGIKLLINWRFFVTILVAVMWSAPVWGPISGTAREIVAALSDLTVSSMFANSGGLHIIVQATLSFAGFLLVAVGLMFHQGLGALPRTDPSFLHFRQILARQVAIVFLAALAWLTIAGPDALTFETMRPFLIVLVPLGGLYIAPLMSIHMREMTARGAVVIAVLILFASPTQYSDTSGGFAAWYLELRASEEARTPLL